MYLKIDKEYADREFWLLSDLLITLDEEVTEVTRSVAISADPESDGLTDRGEYFIGVGLSAIQQYLTDTITLTGIGKDRAFDIGPRYSSQFTFVSAVNAAANWWKHSAEWYGISSQNRKARKTQEIVIAIAGSEAYPLSNILAELLSTSEIKLSALLPSLALWREAIDYETKHYA